MTNPEPKPRYYFLDVLRSLALIEMIHGHTLDALLAPALRNTPFYYGLQFFRGITAPLFLFIAGFCFGLATFTRSSVMSRLTPQLWQRLKRIFTVIVTGYLLYMPFFSIIKTIQHINTPVWQTFLRTDILRCIGVMLLFLQFITFFRLNKSLFYIFFVSFTLALPLLHPLVGNSSLISRLPDFFRYYLLGSHFPLIYYGSYVTLGCICSRLFHDNRPHWQLVVGLIGIAILTLAVVLNFVLPSVSFTNYAVVSAFIILLTLITSQLESWWQKLPLCAKYFGQESLFIYVTHLLIIYGSGYNHGLRFYLSPSLSWLESYLVFLAVFLIMVISACSLHRVC